MSILVYTYIYVYRCTHMYITFIYIHACILPVMPSLDTVRTNCPAESQYGDEKYMECHGCHFIQVLLSFLPLGNFQRHCICKPRTSRNCCSEINSHNETTLLMTSDFLYSLFKWKQESCINASALQFLHKLKILFSFLSSASETSETI